MPAWLVAGVALAAAVVEGCRPLKIANPGLGHLLGYPWVHRHIRMLAYAVYSVNE
jgi:hypothetical protein